MNLTSLLTQQVYPIQCRHPRTVLKTYQSSHDPSSQSILLQNFLLYLRNYLLLFPLVVVSFYVIVQKVFEPLLLFKTLNCVTYPLKSTIITIDLPNIFLYTNFNLTAHYALMATS